MRKYTFGLLAATALFLVATPQAAWATFSSNQGGQRPCSCSTSAYPHYYGGYFTQMQRAPLSNPRVSGGQGSGSQGSPFGPGSRAGYDSNGISNDPSTRP